VPPNTAPPWAGLERESNWSIGVLKLAQHGHQIDLAAYPGCWRKGSVQRIGESFCFAANAGFEACRA
jgi:hypothetical protein